MKKLLLPLLAAAALAAPAAAFAHHGHHGWHHHRSMLAQLSGTGGAFSGSSATASGSIARSDTLGTGTFSVGLTTDWTKAETRTGDRGTLKCAPSTASLTLTGSTTSNTLTSTLAGKACTWTPTTGSAVSAFFGRGAATGAGALATVTGTTAKAWLVQQADGTVKGAVFAASRDEHSLLFTAGESRAGRAAGGCHH